MLRASDLTQKEVINVTDGRRVGLIMDLEVDLNKGKVNAIIIPSAGKFLGIFGKELDYEISWDQIKKIGEDVILVEMRTLVEPQQYNESFRDQYKYQYKENYKELYKDENTENNKDLKGSYQEVLEENRKIVSPEFVKKHLSVEEK